MGPAGAGSSRWATRAVLLSSVMLARTLAKLGTHVSRSDDGSGRASTMRLCLYPSVTYAFIDWTRVLNIMNKQGTTACTPGPVAAGL